jgi:hypothetical protein
MIAWALITSPPETLQKAAILVSMGLLAGAGFGLLFGPLLWLYLQGTMALLQKLFRWLSHSS